MAIIRWGNETEITDIHWLWKPMIPYGKVTLIEGDGGDGKTTMILTIAAMLSRGQPPPDLQAGRLHPAAPVPPATTFYLTNEDEIADSSLKRFLRAGGDVTRFAYSGETEYHVTLREEELRQILHETSARLLIIDPFQAFLPEGVSLSSVTHMRSVFTMLGNVARSTGAAIVLIGHLNKHERGKDIHRGFGSADIAASVRSILLVERDKNKNRFVRAVKSNFDESDFTRIRLDFDEDHHLTFRETAPPPPPAPAGRPDTKIKKAQTLLRTLLEKGPRPVSEISHLLAQENISIKTARRAKDLLGAESLSLNGVTCWKLP